MQVYFRHENRAYTLTSLSSTAGGEGNLCKIDGDPSRCVKDYTAPVPSDLEDRLEFLVGANVALPGARVAWPLDIVEDGTGHVTGYVQEFVGPGFVPVSQLISPLVRPAWVNEKVVRLTGYEMAHTVAELHDQGFLFPDLHDEQFLTAPSQAPVLIDAASVQFTDHNRLFPCTKVRREYQAPEFVTSTDWSAIAPRRDVFSDAWSLNVLLFRLVMSCHPFDAIHVGTGTSLPLAERVAQGHFPFDKRCRDYRPPRHAPVYRSLAPELRDMFQRCFVDGHALGDRHLRPLPAECADVLRHCQSLWSSTTSAAPGPATATSPVSGSNLSWPAAVGLGALLGLGLSQVSDHYKLQRRDQDREIGNYRSWFNINHGASEDRRLRDVIDKIRSQAE